MGIEVGIVLARVLVWISGSWDSFGRGRRLSRPIQLCVYKCMSAVLPWRLGNFSVGPCWQENQGSRHERYVVLYPVNNLNSIARIYSLLHDLTVALY